MKKCDVLYNVMLSKGYPENFVREVVYRNLNTDFTASRMLGYLAKSDKPSLEDIADEMFAILSDRERITKKKKLEHSMTVINRMYREKDNDGN